MCVFSRIKKHILILFISTFIFGCKDVNHYTSNSTAADQDPQSAYLSLNGRAVKGAVQEAFVSVYRLSNGTPGGKAFASAITDETGNYAVSISRRHHRHRRLVYLEVKPNAMPETTSRMVCDALNGCGVRNNQTVHFGEKFTLRTDFLMRSVTMFDPQRRSLAGNFSPLLHTMVARAENMSGGLTWENINHADQALTKLFLFSHSLRSLTPVNLLSVEEAMNASDERLVKSILEAAYLNIGLSPEYVPVEEVLLRTTTLGGHFEDHVPGDYSKLSLNNLFRAAYGNIPEYLVTRTGVASHLREIIKLRTPELARELGFTGKEGERPTVSIDSSVGGSVKVKDLGVVCDVKCDYAVQRDHYLTLIAIPNDGYELSHWEQDCRGSSSGCRLYTDREKNVKAIFVPIEEVAKSFSLNLSVVGSGRVVEQLSSSHCSSESCAAELMQGSTVLLNPYNNNGYHFDGWTGDCSGSGSCELVMDKDKSVTAHFSPVVLSLSVEIIGNGSIKSASGLSCMEDYCQFDLPFGERLNFSFFADQGYQFEAWSGDCLGVANCLINMDSNKTLIARFNPVVHALTLNTTQGGQIVSADDSVTCSKQSCTHYLNEGNKLELQAIATKGYQFDGWGGDCTGSVSCSITVGRSMSLSANFSPVFHELSVSVTGGGSIASLAAGLHCETGTCTAKVQEGKELTLSALPADGYEFSHWSGQCDHSEVDCRLVMEGDYSLSTKFEPISIDSGSIYLTWLPPGSRENGVAISLNEIRSYTIYYGQHSGQYSRIQVIEPDKTGTVPTNTILHDLEAGKRYYISGTTTDTNGLVSQFSVEIEKTAKSVTSGNFVSSVLRE